ncbi:MAG: hypothetical protein ACKOET_11010, partial [Verrucomicrobiota bacterium]
HCRPSELAAKVLAGGTSIPSLQHRQNLEATVIDIKMMDVDLLRMVKTQIQVPEELFREIRAFARQREWSLAETFRRGAELLLQVYAETPSEPPAAWTPPTSEGVGWKGLTAGQLREAAWADADPTPPHPHAVH